MFKYMMTVAVLALALTTTAHATSKAPGTRTAQSSWNSRSYATSSSSYSFGYTNEITTMASMGSFTSGKPCEDCRSGSVLDVGLGYLRAWKDNIQFGGEGRFQQYSEEVSPVGKSASRIDLLGVAVYNLESDFKNSIFVKGGLGIFGVVNNQGDGFENKFGFFVGAGKRFNWLSSIAYSPELRLVKRGDIDIAIEIALLNFSIYWN